MLDNCHVTSSRLPIFRYRVTIQRIGHRVWNIYWARTLSEFWSSRKVVIFFRRDGSENGDPKTQANWSVVLFHSFKFAEDRSAVSYTSIQSTSRHFVWTLPKNGNTHRTCTIFLAWGAHTVGEYAWLGIPSTISRLSRKQDGQSRQLKKN